MNASQTARGARVPGPLRLLGRVLRVLAFVLVQVVLAGFIGVALLRYGPFENTRNFIIGSAMTSYRHQYIARLLFTQPEIEAVIGKDKTADTTEEQNENAVNPTGRGDSSVALSKISNGVSGYALEIRDASRVHVACTRYVGVKGELVSTFARRFNALAAINGGGFTSGAATTGNGSIPSDFVFSNGQLVYQDATLDADEKPSGHPANVIALTQDGHLLVGSYSINELKAAGVTDAVDMHDYLPLVLNGKVQYTSKNAASKGTQPRTAIGQKADGTIVLVVIDGRQVGLGGSAGASLDWLANLMANQFHCVIAGNLDGGGSTAMYYQSRIINQPSQLFGERTVATAFYVSK